MKKLSLITMLLIACSICAAQTVNVSGNVKDEQGKPVHYAFVKNDKLTTATYTDSLGNFSLVTQPGVKVIISANGYSDAVADAGSNVQITLKGTATAEPQATGDAQLLILAFTNNNVKQPGASLGLGGVPVFTNARQLIGHRFLFTEWVHGYMVKANGEIIYNPNYLYNYDKIKGDLFITENLNSVTFANKDQVRSFTLYSHDQPYTYEKMTGISNELYSKLISSGSKYKIYKLTATKFVAANYQTNGITSTGNNYDEFADNDSYYVQDLKTGNFQQLTLKKKAIKAAFPDDSNKLNAFMAAHSDDKIDDDYLKSLGDALNQ